MDGIQEWFMVKRGVYQIQYKLESPGGPGSSSMENLGFSVPMIIITLRFAI